MIDAHSPMNDLTRCGSALLIGVLLSAAPLLGLDAYPVTTISEVATSVG
jgi:hypothetical protein